MTQAVLFDLDGTVADTAPDLAAALNYVLGLEDLPPLAIETVRPAAAFGSAKLIGLGLGEDHPRAELRKTQLLDYYESHIADATTLFPGMDTVLSTLHTRQIPFGIVTNKPERFTLPLLAALQVDTPCVVCGDSTAHSKPHPLPLFTACEKLASVPEQSLFVGDSIIDVTAANAAHMPVVVAAYGYLQKDDTITDWDITGSIDTPLALLDFI